MTDDIILERVQPDRLALRVLQLPLSFAQSKADYAADNSIGSTIVGSSFSGLLTRVDIGHMRIDSAENGRIRSPGSGSSPSPSDGDEPTAIRPRAITHRRRVACESGAATLAQFGVRSASLADDGTHAGAMAEIFLHTTELV